MSDKYELPLPVLSVDTDALEIETKDIHRGQIFIKNTGGGVLSGRVLSRCRGLIFEPAEFEIDSAHKHFQGYPISYTFNAAAELGIGEACKSRFFITSNGGEKEIPVTAKLIKMSISTPDGYLIANIKDFYEYSLTHAAQARRLFTDSEFHMLLRACGYEFIEVYESLQKDANRERAMDNFFVLSGLKERTALNIVGGVGESPARLEFSRPPGESEKITGSFQVQKSDAGYVEAPLLLAGDAPWLSLASGRLTTADFENNIAVVSFTIDPKRVEGVFAREKILVGASAGEEGAAVDVAYRRLPPVTMRLNRDAYRYTDHGCIEVINNTGETMQISVFCPESYIRFAERSFPIGERGEIPFQIKLSAFMSAQMLFRKTPFMRTVIELKAKLPGREFKKTLDVVVGEW